MSGEESAADSSAATECAGCLARDRAAARMISSTRWWLTADSWPPRAPADFPVGLCEAWFASDAERFAAEWESWTGGLAESIRSLLSEVRNLQHTIDSFVRTSLERMDEALPPESAELAVMKAVTSWLTGEIGVPAAVAAVWSDRDGKRTWAEWDQWLFEQLQRVPADRLWSDVEPPESKSALSHWEMVVSRVFGLAMDGVGADEWGRSAQVLWAKYVMQARAVLRVALSLDDSTEIWREWSSWLRFSMMALDKRYVTAGWDQYAETLPPELRAMARVEPTEQAEVAALTFELGAAHGYDLYFPPDPPEEK